MSDVAQVLEDAADLLLVHGRCTGQQQDEAGRMCARGAIAKAATGDAECWLSDRAYPAVEALERSLIDHPVAVAYLDQTTDEQFVREQRRQRWFPTSLWNDIQRTADGDFEVIDTLRRVAKDIRNQEAE